MNKSTTGLFAACAALLLVAARPEGGGASAPRDPYLVSALFWSAPVTAVPATGHRSNPYVAAADDQYLVAWADYFSDTGDYPVTVATVAPANGELAGPWQPWPQRNAVPTALCATDDAYLLASVAPTGRWDVVVGAIERTTLRAAEPYCIACNPGAQEVAFDLASAGNFALLTWLEGDAQGRIRLKATLLSSTGQPLWKEPVQIPPSVSDRNQISATAAWTGSDFVVAWIEESGHFDDLFIQRLDPSGTLLGVPVHASGGTTLTSHPSLSSSGRSLLLAWNAGASEARTVIAKRLTGELVPIDIVPVTLSTSGVPAGPPSVAWDGSAFACSFPARPGTVSRLFWSRIPDAVSPGWGSHLLSSLSGSHRSPQIAALDGGRSLIAWVRDLDDFGQARTEIRSSRLAGEEVFDSEDLLVSGRRLTQRAPLLTGSGTHPLAAWFEESSTGGTSFRVTPVSTGQETPRATTIFRNDVPIDFGHSAAAAWNGHSHLLLAASDALHGALVGPDPGEWRPVQIKPTTSANAPAIAAVPAGFRAAWVETAPTTNLWTAHVDTDGNVSPAGGEPLYSNGQVSFDGLLFYTAIAGNSDRSYLAWYEASRSGGLFGVMLDSLGRPVGNPTRLDAEAYFDPPHVTAAGLGWTVTWSSPSGILACEISPGGQPTWPVPRVLVPTRPGLGFSRPRTNIDGAVGLLTYLVLRAVDPGSPVLRDDRVEAALFFRDPLRLLAGPIEIARDVDSLSAPVSLRQSNRTWLIGYCGSDDATAYGPQFRFFVDRVSLSWH